MAVLVSLQEFFASGAFGPVVPGCTPTELEAVFGPPEATGGQSRRHRQPSIWKYGDIQFFFGRPGGLHMVHSDTFFGPGGRPEGWGGLRLEPWCVRDGLPLGELLSVAGSGQVRSEPQFERVVVSFPSGVEVGFTPDEGLFGLWRKWADAEQGVAPDRGGT
jgi:hypothetical protein